jgi:hypothetical protein
MTGMPPRFDPGALGLSVLVDASHGTGIDPLPPTSMPPDDPPSPVMPPPNRSPRRVVYPYWPDRWRLDYVPPGEVVCVFRLSREPEGARSRRTRSIVTRDSLPTALEWGATLALAGADDSMLARFAAAAEHCRWKSQVRAATTEELAPLPGVFVASETRHSEMEDEMRAVLEYAGYVLREPDYPGAADCRSHTVELQPWCAGTTRLAPQDEDAVRPLLPGW